MFSLVAGESEVGHCLGLFHTHHGVDEVTQCGDCYEAAGRSAAEGDVTGDWCSDTNPTPGTNRSCVDPPGTDPCSGNPWIATPYLSYMGYAYVCESEFTPQQAGRMHCWTEDLLSGWLQLPMPPAAPGTPTVTLQEGIARIAWADNSNNEEGFRVQRESKLSGGWVNPQIVATVEANTTLATNAPGPGVFRYRVRAFNTIGDSAWSAWKQINNNRARRTGLSLRASSLPVSAARRRLGAAIGATKASARLRRADDRPAA